MFDHRGSMVASLYFSAFSLGSAQGTLLPPHSVFSVSRTVSFIPILFPSLSGIASWCQTINSMTAAP